MTRVSVDDLELAIAWLRFNEGTDGESDAMFRVADWLQVEIDRRMINQGVRKLRAVAADISNAKLREKIRARMVVNRTITRST